MSLVRKHASRSEDTVADYRRAVVQQLVEHMVNERFDELSRKPDLDPYLRFAAATGLRPSELCGLRIGRLNLVKGTAEVAEALTVVLENVSGLRRRLTPRDDAPHGEWQLHGQRC